MTCGLHDRTTLLMHRTITAAERGYEPSGHGFTEGDTVRSTELVGDRFTVLGIRGDNVECFEQRPGTGHRTLPASTLVLASPTAAHAAHLAGLAR